jgi:energy-coupling factor transporter ATP-binding protein EcfA2
MATVALGLPRPLPGDPAHARLRHFQEFTVAHPLLVAAKDKLMDAIRESPPNSIVFVSGPTGVGKTTLRKRIEQILAQEMLAELETDRGRLPVVSVEAVAPESGSFNWRDHFRRLLFQMDEPLVDFKRVPRDSLKPEAEERPTIRFLPGSRAAGPEYRYAVEQALSYRRPVAVLIDEAQHLAKMASGRRLLDQLDVIKSMANRTQTVHVLFGTYDLLAFRNLSGQLSRRSIDVHFRRYQAESADDRRMFLNVVRSFEQQIPFAEPLNLDKHWEYLYERSIGCVGVLKEWLVKAVSAVLRQGGDRLTVRDLEKHALSFSQCEKMLAETTEGELRLAEGEAAHSRLRMRLGLEFPKGHAPSTSATNRKRPGHRSPRRDPVGKPIMGHAAKSTP